MKLFVAIKDITSPHDLEVIGLYTSAQAAKEACIDDFMEADGDGEDIKFEEIQNSDNMRGWLAMLGDVLDYWVLPAIAVNTDFTDLKDRAR